MAMNTEGAAEAVPSVTPSEGQDDATLVSDLSKVDPKALQAEIDRQVTKAIKSREENLSKKAEAEKAAQERKAAEERGEYEKLRAMDREELQKLKQSLIIKDVTSELRESARAEGLIDMDDLMLMQSEAVASAVSEDGKIDVDKLRGLVLSFKAAKPHKFKGNENTSTRFGGTATAPPAPGSTPVHRGRDYYKTDGLAEYVNERNRTLKAMKSQDRKGAGNIGALAEAIVKRLKP